MEHVRLSYLTLDPSRLDDVVADLAEKGRPVIEGEPGNRGISIAVSEEVGVVVAASFWVSGDAMRDSEKRSAPVWTEAARLGTGTVSVERYEVASQVRVERPGVGAGVRLTRVGVAPDRVDEAVAAYEDAALPWLTESAGFCSALLFVRRRTGEAVQETVWQDPAALAASRARAAAIRVEAVTATDAVVRALEEFRTVVSTAPLA